jgi:hypothetical protein
MLVYDDYNSRRFGRYFTAEFVTKHLQVGHYIALGGHKAARERARIANVTLNRRFQRGNQEHGKENKNPWDTDLNSLIFDSPEDGNPERQVFHLMKEVEKRNTERFYTAEIRKAGKIETIDAYFICTARQGSRQKNILAKFYYNVRDLDGTGRFVICHFGGIVPAEEP